MYRRHVGTVVIDLPGSAYENKELLRLNRLDRQKGPLWAEEHRPEAESIPCRVEHKVRGRA